MPKGENPKSQQNLIAGKNKKPNSRKTPMQLSEEARALAKKAGDGNMTLGVELWAKLYSETNQDRLFAQSLVFLKVKNLVEAIALSDSKFSEQASSLLSSLEDF